MGAYSDAVNALSPLAYWRLGEASGTVAVDETGLHDGTYFNTPTLGSDPLIPGETETSVLFDKASFEYMETGHIIDYAAFSITALIKVGNDFTTNMSVYHHGRNNASGNQGINLTVKTDKSLQVVIFDGAWKTITSAIDLIEANTVYQVCVTKNASNLVTLYLNDVKIDDLTINNLYLDNAKFTVGCGYNTDFYNFYSGNISKVGYFTTALTLEEISTLYDIIKHKAFNITIDHTKVDEDLYDFPLLVNLGATSGIDAFDSEVIFDNISDTIPDDIKVLNAIYINPADGQPPIPPDDITMYSRQCKVEIDRWDQVNKQAQLWVKVPYISKDVDTVISLSYDTNNPDNSENVGYTGELPAQLVWSDYDAVYHLSADGADSTANALDGTLINMDGTNIVDFGIGKGLTFNGTDEYIDIGLKTEFNLLATENMTNECIFKSNNVTLPQKLLQNRGTDVGSTGGFFNRITASELNSLVGVNGVVQQVNYTTLLPLTNQTLYNSTFTFEQAAPNLQTIVNNVDESGVDNIQGDMTDVVINSVRNTTIGCAWDSAVLQSQFMNGTLKEIRFSKSLKSANYISTNYDSMQDSLTRFTAAESYILAKSILGSITENVAVANWIIRAYRLTTGELLAQMNAIAGDFTLDMPVGTWFPSTVTVSPDQGLTWTPVTAQLIDDLVFPTDPETTPYYYKCTVSGTGVDGVTGSVEPTWPTGLGNTVVDGTVTWEVVERMIQPITHSPMIPK